MRETKIIIQLSTSSRQAIVCGRVKSVYHLVGANEIERNGKSVHVVCDNTKNNVYKCFAYVYRIDKPIGALLSLSIQ